MNTLTSSPGTALPNARHSSVRRPQLTSAPLRPADSTTPRRLFDSPRKRAVNSSCGLV
jgi:hypothetical protein